MMGDEDFEYHRERMWWWTSGIGDDNDYDLAIKYFEGLMEMDPPKFSPHGDMLEYWGAAISKYEEKRWAW